MSMSPQTAAYAPKTPDLYSLSTDADGLVAFNMADLNGQEATVDVTAATTFSTKFRTEGRRLSAKVVNDTESAIALTFPSWIWVGDTPSALAAGKTARLKVTFYDATDETAVAEWRVGEAGGSGGGLITDFVEFAPVWGGITVGTPGANEAWYQYLGNNLRVLAHFELGAGSSIDSTAVTLGIPLSLSAHPDVNRAVGAARGEASVCSVVPGASTISVVADTAATSGDSFSLDIMVPLPQGVGSGGGGGGTGDPGGGGGLPPLSSDLFFISRVQRVAGPVDGDDLIAGTYVQRCYINGGATDAGSADRRGYIRAIADAAKSGSASITVAVKRTGSNQVGHGMTGTYTMQHGQMRYQDGTAYGTATDPGLPDNFVIWTGTITSAGYTPPTGGDFTYFTINTPPALGRTEIVAGTDSNGNAYGDNTGVANTQLRATYGNETALPFEVDPQGFGV